MMKITSTLPRLLAALTLALLTLPALAAPLRLAIPPFFAEEETRTTFTPLADYLSKTIGQEIQLVTYPNYLSFWEKARQGGSYELVLDSAPMTDFRIQRQKFNVVARLDGQVTQSLVTAPDLTVLDPQELVNRRVATQPSPSVSSLVLYQIFSNPTRQPRLVHTDTTRAAVEAVLNGKAEAALIPTPIAAGYPNLNVVMTTQAIPFLAMSAAPGVPEDMRDKLRTALVQAKDTEAGREVLRKSNLSAFVPSQNNEYTGQAELLRGTFGY